MEYVSSYDQLFRACIGQKGPYQIFLTFMVFVHRLWEAWHILLVLIVAPAAGGFYCNDRVFEECDKDCLDHKFDRTVWKQSIIYEWDLVCGRAWLVGFIQCVIMLGILIGTLVFGILNERLGRKLPLLLACVLQFGSGLATAFVKDVYIYTFLRFLTTIGTGGAMVTSFQLLMEFTDVKYRNIIGILFMVPLSVGQALLGIIGSISRTWTTTHLIVSIPSFILVSYVILPDSPRWLILRRKGKQCIKTLERGAKCNKLPTAHIRGEVESYASRMTGDIQDRKKYLMRTKRTKTKFLIMCGNWSVTYLVFYGVAQYFGHIPGNVFLNLIISGLVQIPATFVSIKLIDRVGRRKTIMLGYIIITAPMVIVAFLPASKAILDWPIKILCCLAMCGAAMNFAVMYLYSGELFPTITKPLALAICSICGRIGGMIAPFIVYLQYFSGIIPPILLALFAAMGAGLTFLLPETKNVPLPYSVEDADKL